MNIICYYRRSKKDYDSTLGLESQRSAVLEYAKRTKGKVIHEFTEIESGTRKNRHKRTVILQAIAMCKDEKAILVIAKLDRLARDLEFITSLGNSGVKFVACDMPDANELTIHILAAVAQAEAKTISARITSALAEKKKKGEPLGWLTHKNPVCPLSNEGRVKAAETLRERARENPNNQRAVEYAKLLVNNGLPFKTVAEKMNNQGFKSPKGFKVNEITVTRWVR